MSKLPTYERDVVVMNVCSLFSSFALVLSLVLMVPLFMGLFSAAGYAFMYICGIIWDIALVFYLIFLVFGSACTLFLCWIIEGFREHVAHVLTLFDFSSALSVVSNVAPSVFGAYKIICPIVAVFAAAAATVSLVLCLKNKKLAGFKKNYAKSIVSCVFTGVGVLSYVILLFVVYSAVL